MRFGLFPFRQIRLLTLLASCALGNGVIAAEVSNGAGTAKDVAKVPEPAVRAALLFNFIKFTDWPAAGGEHVHLEVCIASGNPELITALEALNARQVRGKALLTIAYGQEKHCDVIYVDSRQRWQSMAENLDSTHALTVAGYPGFVADGGMIEIALQEGGSRFDINLGKAKKAGLRLYPQFLRLARRIVE